eukprot:3565577-Rhodomonas_salina.1
MRLVEGGGRGEQRALPLHRHQPPLLQHRLPHRQRLFTACNPAHPCTHTGEETGRRKKSRAGAGGGLKAFQAERAGLWEGSGRPQGVVLALRLTAVLWTGS